MADSPLILSTNPWASRSAWLADNGETLVFYLGLPTAPEHPLVAIASVWVRNLGVAPETAAPIEPPGCGPQPRRHTRHPQGKPLGRGRVLEILWLEEGDSAALLVDGVLEAVLPPWSSKDGFHGYAREARGRGPFAWELIVPNPLADRVDRARAHWQALGEGILWPHIAAADQQHLTGRIGPMHTQWLVTPAGEPPRGVACFQDPAAGPIVYSTLGMAAEPMPGLERRDDLEDEADLAHRRRVQVVLASAHAADWIVALLGEIARYPWRAVTWLDDGHVLAAPGIEPAARGRFTAVLLSAAPPPAASGPAPALDGQYDRTGDPIRYLWALPITAREHQLAEEQGTQALLEQLTRSGASWLHDPDRSDLTTTKETP